MIEGCEKFKYLGYFYEDEYFNVPIFVFEEGFYVQEYAGSAPQGWHAWKNHVHKGNIQVEAIKECRVSFVNRNDDSLGQWLTSFMAGKFDVSADAASCYCIVNSYLAPTGGDIVFGDTPLVTSSSPKFKKELDSDYAMKVLQNGFEYYDPNGGKSPIESIDELQQNNWGICSFVAAIQAAYFQASRKDLLKHTHYDTLAPVILSFLEKYRSELARGSDYLFHDKTRISVDEAISKFKEDVEMKLRLKISFDSSTLKLLLDMMLGATGYVLKLADARITQENLALKNVIYTSGCVTIDSDGWPESPGSHVVYVDADSQHYLWGKKRNALTACIQLEDLKYNGIVEFVVFNEQEKTPLDAYVIQPIVTNTDPVMAASGLVEGNWQVSGLVATIQAADDLGLVPFERGLVNRLALGPWIETFARANEDLEREVRRFGRALLCSLGKENALFPAFIFKEVVSLFLTDMYQNRCIPFAITPRALCRICTLYKFPDFNVSKLVEATGADCELTSHNLASKHTIYGLGRHDHALYNGLMHWAYVDKAGNLLCMGQKIEAAKMVDFLKASDKKLDKITHYLTL